MTLVFGNIHPVNPPGYALAFCLGLCSHSRLLVFCNGVDGGGGGGGAKLKVMQGRK